MAKEIQIRAERKAGEFLAQEKREPGKRTDLTSSNDGSGSTNYERQLNKVGVSPQDAHRWQSIAAMPELKFENHIAEVKENGGELTTAGLMKSFNYKRDTKRTNEQDIYTPQGMDACQTPAYAIDPLLPYLSQFNRIWEPACGEGLLVEALLDSKIDVFGSDIIEGNNFFDFEAAEWDCIVTNPPYSIKFQWMARCYALGKPFALLMPVETLGAKTSQELFEKFGMEIMLLDKRVNFKMPNKGWDSGGAQFPTAWFTWKLNLPSQITYGKISYE